MKKFNSVLSTIVGIFIMTLLVFAYSSKVVNSINAKEKYTSVIAKEQASPKTYLTLNKLPKQYNYDLAVKYGDVVSRLGKTQNIEKLDKFIKDYEAKTLKNNDMIRITSYSVVGKPVIRDLVFTTEGLKLIVDPTRVSEKLKVEECKAASISIDTRGENITYILNLNTNKEIYLISTSQ
jgi:hypothetical protein